MPRHPRQLASRPRSRRSRLRWFLGLSVALHLLIPVLLELVPDPPLSVAGLDVTELDVARGEEGARRAEASGKDESGASAADARATSPVVQRGPRPRVTEGAGPRPPKTGSATVGKGTARRAKARGEGARGGAGGGAGGGEGARGAGGDPCLLSMRGCSAGPERDVGADSTGAGSGGGSGTGAGSGGHDRFASFRPRPGGATASADAPTVQSRVSVSGVELLRYEDGGRLLRSTGGRVGPPGAGEVGLLSLASSPIGESTGRLACNPYRVQAPAGERDLVLLVDTSGSIVANKRVPSVLVCAAGAALAALARGQSVVIVNFSRESWFYQRTRSTDAVYKALARMQGESTLLPRLALLPLKPADARDYVLVSDAAIQNLKDVLPEYTRRMQRERGSRWFLYVVGEDPETQVAALERAGFRSDRLERPGRGFRAFAAETLRQLVPPLRQLSRGGSRRPPERPAGTRGPGPARAERHPASPAPQQPAARPPS